MTTNKPPADAHARKRALEPAQSFIVRAPAGSGKTELLTRRFLKLLATANEPEEVLAITFTRAATAEMRNRVLNELEKAYSGEPAPDDDGGLLLAREALARSHARGWRLIEQPHRLNIETIDSLCLRIARNQPLLSRLGGALSPSDDAGPLYGEAARRTLGLLGSAKPELDDALAHLLELRDNNLPNCEALLAGMLERRDQWVRAFPAVGIMDEDDWDQLRSRLERPFREEVKRVHAQAYRLIMREPLLSKELFELAHYANENGNPDVALLAGTYSLPVPEAAATDHWLSICALLLTKDGCWRKQRGINKTIGFPSTTANQKAMKERMVRMLERFQQIEGLEEALSAIRRLPEPRYNHSQWSTLRHIFMVLRRAQAELRVLFAERNTVDFVELNIAAQNVLRSSDPDALLAISGNIRHILVDEFQDTSRTQHDLLCLLIRAWNADGAETCFLVGDPMQSIYLFRQAEVELFAHVTENGIVSPEHTISLEPLELVTNFRSHAGLTTRWNEMFDAIFAQNGPAHGVARVRYSHTFAAKESLPQTAVHIHPQIIGEPSARPTPEDKTRARQHEAEQVIEIIAQHEGEIKRATAEGREYRVAVLARTRSHLAQIVALLRERGIPFRAVELETLNQRQELIDLMSLTKALLHPMDRVAWLAVLRAPWCGLTLLDLHMLSGADDPAFRHESVRSLIEQRRPLLTSDGAARVDRVVRILDQALAVRFEAVSFSQWIERTWRSLGGPHCLDAAGHENVQVFFELLDTLTADGMGCLSEDFETEMERLFAQPDPRVSESSGVQLMTIHKAKGLGFDVVIVPGLDRKPKTDDSPLICSLERTDSRGETEMLVAPIGWTGDEKHPTYAWVQKQVKARSDEEQKRLFYVACTRAKQSLHLLGTAIRTNSGVNPEHADSLLEIAWPALAMAFEHAAESAKKHPGEVIPFPTQRDEGFVFDIAAVAAPQPRPLVLRRLRANIDLSCGQNNVAFAAANAASVGTPFERPHGSRDARQKGNLVHAMLQQLSEGAPFGSLDSRLRFLLRSAAYSGKALDEAAREVMNAVKNCMSDPDGAWILAPHAHARSETSWTSLRNGTLETLRADRVFVAGAAPHGPGEDHLWIIDYKMSTPAGHPDFLARQRATYASQLARYARALRDAEGVTLPVCFGLYYPGIACLDWWSEEPSDSK